MRGALAVVIALSACAGRDAKVTPAAPTKPIATQRSSAEMLQNLAFLATGAVEPASKIDDVAAKIAKGELTVDKYIDSLLADPRFAKEVAPRVLLKEWQFSGGLYALPPGYILKKTAADAKGRVAYYLRDDTCTPDKAQKVHPWWALDQTILVCSTAYQPDHFADESGHRCNGVQLAPGETASKFCGCGPNLVRCYPDADRFAKLSKSLISEVDNTAAKIVGDDRPLSDLFTANETFRDRDAEFVYQRWRVENREIQTVPDLRSWPEGGKWAPRFESQPGEHAGILTTTQVIFRETGLRSITKNIFDKIWCKGVESANVQAAFILSLKATDLRAGEGWQQLAHRPVCDACHARMDYAMQFLKGYTDVRIGTLFVPQKPGTAQIYGDDMKDLRGMGEQTPHGFAKLAVAQPEFASCMAEDVTHHVFNDRAEPDDAAAILDAMTRTGKMRDMMKVALVRYAASYGKQPAAAKSTIAALPAPPKAPDGMVAIAPHVRSMLEEQCSDCHSDGDHDFRPSTLPRVVVEKMLSRVAFGQMPKPPMSLTHEGRRQLITELIANLWSSPSDREEALAYFGDRMRALPIHRGPLALGLVRQRTGTDDPSLINLMETRVRQDEAQFTPEFATVIGLQALKGCKKAGHKGADLDKCIEAATEPTELINGLDR